MIAVLDYEIGNLRSAQKAFEHLGADARLTADPALVRDADGVVLPGVGAFGRCMDALRAHGLDDLAHEVRPLADAPEAHDARDAEPLQPGQGRRLAHQRVELAVVGVGGEDLHRELAAAEAIAHAPHLAAAPLAEGGDGLVPRGERRRLHARAQSGKR